MHDSGKYLTNVQISCIMIQITLILPVLHLAGGECCQENETGTKNKTSKVGLTQGRSETGILEMRNVKSSLRQDNKDKTTSCETIHTQ